MQTREQLYKTAFRQIQSSRQKAVVMADQKRQIAFEKIPQLPKLLGELNRNKALASRYSVLGSSEQVEQQKTVILNSEKELQQLLIEYGYNEHSFDPQFSCSLCQDRGEYQGKTCRCVHLLVRQLRRKEISAISALELSTFESFRMEYYPDYYMPEYQGNPRKHMEEILGYCKQYAEHFTTKNPNLLMTGTAGLGKTHLALSIANTAIQRGADVIYISSRNLFDQMEREKFAVSSDLRQMVMEAELLILDDLGTEFLTQYGISFLYDIVNSRILRRLPTIYTTNILKEDMLRARYTEKTASRLLGSCELLNFWGNDIRLLENG